MRRSFGILLSLPTIIVLLLLAFISLLFLSECWNVIVNNEVENYPWGFANDNPWFYETPTKYAAIQFIQGALLLGLTIISTKQFICGKDNFHYWMLAAVIFVLAVILIGL
jgi:ABC-type phosphate transport system permease subunit